MADTFEIIFDEFSRDLETARVLVVTFADARYQARTKVAAANSATLLVAAIFEEFVREMAREYARVVVAAALTFDQIPKSLSNTAWKRTMDGLAKIKFDSGNQRNELFGTAQTKFSVILEFCQGDLSKDIYRELIHNDSNMHPAQLNTLFKISGLGDVCGLCAKKQTLLDNFGESDSGKAHGKLIAGLNDFFERRNGIAHALNAGQSSGPDQIQTDITMLLSFGEALRDTLSETAPVRAPPVVVQPSVKSEARKGRRFWEWIKRRKG